MSGRISKLGEPTRSSEEEHRKGLSPGQVGCDDSLIVFGTKHADLEETKMPNVMIDSTFLMALLGIGIVLLLSLGWAWTMNNVAYDAAKWDMWRDGVKMITVASTVILILLIAGWRGQIEPDNCPSDKRYAGGTIASARRSLLLKKAIITFLVIPNHWNGLLGTGGLWKVLKIERFEYHNPCTIDYLYLTEVDMGGNHALCCNGLYTTYTQAVMSAGDFKSSLTDCWGNVKIPDYERLGPHSPKSTQWRDISSNGNISYSSIVGVPIHGVPTEGNTTFAIETSYYSVACSNVTMGGPVKFHIIEEGAALDGLPIYNGPLDESHTYFGLDSTASFSFAAAGFQRFDWPERWRQEVPHHWDEMSRAAEQAANEPQPLLIQSTLWGNSIHEVLEPRKARFPNNTLSAFCTVQNHYMTVNISCTRSSCAATSMRPSYSPHPNPNITDLGHIRAFYFFTSGFMIAGRDGHAVISGDLIDGNTLTEYYLQDASFGSPSRYGPDGLHWGHYGPYSEGKRLSNPEEFAIRLQQVMNGFRMLLMGGPWYATYPTVNNSMVTVGDNVVWEEKFVLEMWRFILSTLVTVMITGFTTIEMVGRRGVKKQKESDTFYFSRPAPVI